jgi:ZIP family zinc transporter
MMQWFVELNPMTQAFLATCFTWLVTMAGAAVVLFFRNVSQRFLNTMLGFAAGVMIAASYWSLLAPAIEMASQTTTPAWIPAVVGFLLGGVFLKIIDRIMPHLHLGLPIEDAEGIKTRWKRTVLLVLAVTIHNIPEGLAVGVAFGAAGAGLPSATLAGAIALALGIGIQNFPEGTAVAVPLRREGLSVGKSFFFGQLSGIVEIIAGVIGAYLVLVVQSLLPYALSFAAGAMIYVVVEELIPESQREISTDTATLGAMLGFAVMMMLDVAFG